MLPLLARQRLLAAYLGVVADVHRERRMPQEGVEAASPLRGTGARGSASMRGLSSTAASASSSTHSTGPARRPHRRRPARCAARLRVHVEHRLDLFGEQRPARGFHALGLAPAEPAALAVEEPTSPMRWTMRVPIGQRLADLRAAACGRLK
jgi:hypothetical protein